MSSNLTRLPSAQRHYGYAFVMPLLPQTKRPSVLGADGLFDA